MDTLKDIAKNSNGRIISALDLKQSIIEDIKYYLNGIEAETKRLRKTNTSTEAGFRIECREHLREENAIVSYLQQKFNITEAELDKIKKLSAESTGGTKG